MAITEVIEELPEKVPDRFIVSHIIVKKKNVDNLQALNASYLQEAATYLKLNANCKAEEKNDSDHPCSSASDISDKEYSKKLDKLLTKKASGMKFNPSVTKKVDAYIKLYNEYSSLVDKSLKQKIITKPELNQISKLIDIINRSNKDISSDIKTKFSKFDLNKERVRIFNNVEIVEYGISDPAEKDIKIGPIDPRRTFNASYKKEDYTQFVNNSKNFLVSNKQYDNAIRSYTGNASQYAQFSGETSDYTSISNALTGRSIKDPDIINKKIAVLDKLFNESPPIDTDIMLWRGSSGADKIRMLEASKGNLKNLIGTVKECKTFLSCSRSERIADAFASKIPLNYAKQGIGKGLIYEITVPAGSKVVAAENSEFPIESEAIIDRGANMIITNVVDVGFDMYRIEATIISFRSKK